MQYMSDVITSNEVMLRHNVMYWQYISSTGLRSSDTFEYHTNFSQRKPPSHTLPEKRQGVSRTLIFCSLNFQTCNITFHSLPNSSLLSYICRIKPLYPLTAYTLKHLLYFKQCLIADNCACIRWFSAPISRSSGKAEKPKLLLMNGPSRCSRTSAVSFLKSGLKAFPNWWSICREH